MSAGERAREVLAVILVVIGVVLGAASVPAIWLQHNVVDREGFLTIAQPLATDPDFQHDAVEETVAALRDASPLPAWAEDRLEPIVRDQAENLVDAEVFNAMWRASMAELHAQLFDSSGPLVLSVDVGPAIEAVLQPVNDLLPLGLSVEAPQDTEVRLASVPRAGWLAWAAHLDPWAGRAGVAAVVCGVLALLVAPRRVGVLAGIGLALLVVAAVEALLAASIERIVPDAVDRAPILGGVVRAFEDRFAQDMTPQATWLAVAGIGILILAGAWAGARSALCDGRTRREGTG